MSTIAQLEYLVLVILAVALIAFLTPSLFTTRAEVRDGLRKQDIAHLKKSLEDFYNEHEYYPAAPPTCLTSNKPADWTFVEVMPHDVREDQGFVYRYCATSSNPTHTEATGYFLEAQLEVKKQDQIAFDEDELRKFHFRILHEDNKILYRVCGGTATQCTHP